MAMPSGAFPPEGASPFCMQRCGTVRVSTVESGRDPSEPY